MANANSHYAHTYPTTRTVKAAVKSGYLKLFQARLGPQFVVLAEYKFHPTRKWRVDLMIWRAAELEADLVGRPLGVEIDGGGFVGGRHSTGKGIENDCEKYFEAMKLGYRILRITPKHIKSGEAFTWIESLLK